MYKMINYDILTPLKLQDIAFRELEDAVGALYIIKSEDRPSKSPYYKIGTTYTKRPIDRIKTTVKQREIRNAELVYLSLSANAHTSEQILHTVFFNSKCHYGHSMYLIPSGTIEHICSLSADEILEEAKKCFKNHILSYVDAWNEVRETVSFKYYLQRLDKYYYEEDINGDVVYNLDYTTVGHRYRLYEQKVIGSVLERFLPTCWLCDCLVRSLLYEHISEEYGIRVCNNEIAVRNDEGSWRIAL